jgi:uncharacterized membrane protein YeiH
MSYQDVLDLIEVLGVMAFALTGIFEARRLKMDFIGVSSLAMITAFGGGTLRDLFLCRHPLFWIENWPLAAAIFALSLVSVLVLKGRRDGVRGGTARRGRGRAMRERETRRLLLAVTVFDALGLGLFSVLGAVISLQIYPRLYFIAVLMGVITGCFGGVLRDVVGNRVPTVFSKSQLYATCSFAGCVVFLPFHVLGIPEAVSIPISAGVTFAVRMLAVRYNIHLPL